VQGERLERVAQLLKQSLGQIIITRLRDSRLGLVTVTRVTVSPDLTNATVFYSVIGEEKIRKSTQAALNSSRGFLQKEMSRDVKLRITPKLTFQFDTSLEHSLQIEQILKKIQDEDTPSESE